MSPLVWKTFAVTLIAGQLAGGGATPVWRSIKAVASRMIGAIQRNGPASAATVRA